MQNPARLLLVRHGRTEHNVHARLTGWGDPALDELGLGQARLLAGHIARHYRPDLIFTSPLLRTRQTAAPIAAACGVEPIQIEGLREVHFGDIEGMTEAELARHHPEVHARSRDFHDMEFCWPNGESRRDFGERVHGAIDAVIARSRGRTAVVATHGGVISNLLAVLERGSSAYWIEFLTHNCSLTELETDGERFRVVRFNDVSFLPQPAQTTQFVVEATAHAG